MLLEIILAIIILYISITLGHLALRIFRLKQNFWEEIVYSGALGFAIIAYIIFFLGIFGLLYRIFFICFFLVLALILIPEAGRILKAYKKSGKIKLKFNWMIALIFAFLILNLIGSLAPETGWDTQKYHLSSQKEYISNHRITYIHLLQSDLPELIDMLSLMGMLIKSDILAKLVFYLIFLILILAVYVFSKKYFGERVAFLSTLIFISLPNIIYYASTVYTDLALTLFLIIAVFSFFDYWKSGNDKLMKISALFVGIALSTKITAALIVLSFFIMFIIKFISVKEKKECFRDAIIFFLIVLAVSAVWFVKAYACTGNPVYPVAYGIFGGPQNLTYSTEYTEAQLATGGYGKSIFAFLLSPFYLTANGFKFISSFSLSPLFLAFIPLLLFLRRKDKVIKYLLLFSLAYYALWFFIHPFLSKFIPLMAILSIIASYSIIKAFEKKILFKIVWIFVIFSVVFSLAMSGLIYKNQIKVAFGLETKGSYLSKNVDVFDTFNYANKNLDKNSKILMIGEERNYYLNINFQDGDPTRQGLIDYRNVNQEQLGEWLSKQGITHIIVNRNYFVNISDSELNLYGYTEYSYNLIENFLKDNAKQIYEKNNVFLYDIN